MSDASFIAHYRQHRAQVFAWALRYCAGRRALAEDVVQDVFLRAHERWSELSAKGDVQPWLYRVTINEALSRLRRERFSARRLLLWLDPSHEDDTVPLERSSESRELLAALQRLPDLERTIMWLKLVDGHRNGEVAQLLSLSDGYVTKLTQRATERLSSLGWRARDV